MTIRLQVFLSHNGVCSRREAMVVVQSGRVTVNGVIVKEPSTPVDPLKDKITVDGNLIEAKHFDYLMLNKPAGYVTTKEDAHAERTVMDLLPPDLQHVVPVGRLDKDTEGLLLMTNDGDLTFKLTHPKFDVDKTYMVRIGGPLIAEKKRRVEQGVIIDGKVTFPARISGIRTMKEETEFLMTIHEGRKRQVRLMMKAVGCAVVYLKRVAHGALNLGELPIGKWRALTSQEVMQLQTAQRQEQPQSAAVQAVASRDKKSYKPKYSKIQRHHKR